MRGKKHLTILTLTSTHIIDSFRPLEIHGAVSEASIVDRFYRGYIYIYIYMYVCIYIYRERENGWLVGWLSLVGL